MDKKTGKRQKTKIRNVFIAAVCLAMLCACGVQPTQQAAEPVQEAVEPVQEAEQSPAEPDVYDLPLFDSLPKEDSAIDPAFWVAESPNGGKVYLFGSIHVADETAYRLPKRIMDAYLESSALAVEVDTVAYTADEDARKSDEARTTYPDGDTLRDHIDLFLYEELEAYLTAHADDPQLLPSLEDRMPCIWLSALSEIESTAAGLSAELGIDRHFLELAHAQGKQILEIESPASQYDALNQIPDKAYEILLGVSIQTADTAGDSLRATYAEWKAGTLQAANDGEAVEGDMSELAAALSEYDRVILTDRNAVMAAAAGSYLDEGKKVFLVVGTEHLLGSSGVIAQLKAAGYDVTQLGGAEAS